jgi:membrane protein DedA with SNARE-associated domain
MNALIGLLQAHGLPFVFLVVALEQMGLPLPAFPALILAGALSVNDEPTWYALLAVSVVACLLSDVFWYVAGRLYGKRILHLLCKISVTPDHCVSQTQNYFNRFGPKSLLVAKFIPGFNTIAPPLADAAGIGAPRFIAYTLLGSIFWSLATLGTGWYFQDSIGQVLTWFERFSTFALGVLTVALVLYVGWKAIRRWTTA